MKKIKPLTCSCCSRDCPGRQNGLGLPSAFRPGSPARIAAYRARVEAGLCLWHPADLPLAAEVHDATVLPSDWKRGNWARKKAEQIARPDVY